jgi:hypothetical protein
MQTESSLKIGKDKFGHTIYDEAKVLELRATGLGMRKIHNQTLVPKTTLHRIFKRNNIKTFPYQTKKWGNAFRIKERKRMVGQIFKRGSEARAITAKVIRAIRGGSSLLESIERCGACPEIALRWLKKTKSYDTLKWRNQKTKKAGLAHEEKFEFEKERDKIMDREIRSRTAALIKSLKSGIPIEVAARRLGVGRSMAWRWVYKTKAYKILRKKIKATSKWAVVQIRKQKEQKKISLKFSKEKDMTQAAFAEIRKRHPAKTIIKEKNIYETTNNRGLLADFFVKEDNHIYELKQRCDSSSAKEAIGQLFIYKMLGYKVSAIMPNDIIMPSYLSEALKRMKVEMILI